MATISLPNVEMPASPQTLKLVRRERLLIGAHILTALFALMFGLSMGEAGLNGAPRRTLAVNSPYLNNSAKFWLDMTAVSGVILLISSILLYVNVFGTLFFSRKPNPEAEIPITTKSGDTQSPLWFERWGIWIGVLALLLLLAYGPVFAETLDFQNGWNIMRFMPTTNVPMQ